MYVESCTILVVVNRLSRPVVVLDGLPGLYGFKYDSATAYGLPLYLYSYKLVGSATADDSKTTTGEIACIPQRLVFLYPPFGSTCSAPNIDLPRDHIPTIFTNLFKIFKKGKQVIVDFLI